MGLGNRPQHVALKLALDLGYETFPCAAVAEPLLASFESSEQALTVPDVENRSSGICLAQCLELLERRVRVCDPVKDTVKGPPCGEGSLDS